jgi:hypothetical protein
LLKEKIHTDESAAREDENLSLLQWLSRSLLPATFPIFKNSEIDASFYPYIGLTHTIRRAGSRYMLRISDHCRRAPRPVLEAIIMILASKIAHKKPAGKFLELYKSFRNDPFVLESAHERRRLKGRKNFSREMGNSHSLTDMYHEINSLFFNNQIEISRIGWGLRRSWARLGHYDPVHRTITLSPVLDSSGVPGYVVRFIVYHEMLHDIFEKAPSAGFRKHHPAEFRKAERAYPDYESAKKFLRDYCSRRRESGKRRP